MCANEWTDECWCVQVCVCVHPHGDQNSASVVIPSGRSPCYFWGRVSHWSRTHQVDHAGWLMSPRDLFVSMSPVLGLQVCVTKPGLHGCWGLNSCAHSCIASTLLIEFSPSSSLNISYPFAQEYSMVVTVIIPTLRALRHKSSLSPTPRNIAHSASVNAVVLF